MAGKLKVLYYDVTGSQGGSLDSLRTLLGALDRERFEPVLCFGGSVDAARWQAWEVQRFNIAGLDNYDFFPAAFSLRWIYHGLRWLIRFPFDLARCLIRIKRIRPDLVHINCGQALTLGLAARLLHIRCVWHVRELVCDNWLGRFQQRVYRRSADRILAVSRAVAARLARCGDKVEVVPNPVELDGPSREDLERFRAGHELPDDSLAVLLLGNFSEHKGYLFLAEVAERLADLERVVFLLAGSHEDPPANPWHRLLRRLYRGLKRSGGRKAAIRDRWAGLIGRGSARLTGRVDPAAAIAASSLVVCPNTVGEPFGRTVVEAYALGRPVLASDLGNLPELVEDGRTGWLLGLDPEVWAAKIRELVENPELLHQAGERGRERAGEFGPGRHAARIVELYHRLAGDEGKR